jgi:hypothetical protein
MFEKLSKTQPIGRMAKSAKLLHSPFISLQTKHLFLSDYLVDGGFVKLNN